MGNLATFGFVKGSKKCLSNRKNLKNEKEHEMCVIFCEIEEEHCELGESLQLYSPPMRDVEIPSVG